jgi:hypothetical protein
MENKPAELSVIEGRGELVKKLEELISKVRKGEVRSVAWVEVSSTGKTKTRWDVSIPDDFDSLIIQGALQVLSHDLANGAL